MAAARLRKSRRPKDRLAQSGHPVSTRLRDACRASAAASDGERYLRQRRDARSFQSFQASRRIGKAGNCSSAPSWMKHLIGDRPLADCWFWSGLQPSPSIARFSLSTGSDEPLCDAWSTAHRDNPSGGCDLQKGLR